MRRIFLNALLVSAGAVGGVLCGMLGTGGGIIIVFALRYAAKKTGGDIKNCYAQALTVTLVLSAVSAARYMISGTFPVSEALKFIPTAAAGGFAGAWIMGKIDTRWLNRIFSLLLIWAGGTMLFGK